MFVLLVLVSGLAGPESRNAYLIHLIAVPTECSHWMCRARYVDSHCPQAFFSNWDWEVWEHQEVMSWLMEAGMILDLCRMG